MIGDADVYLLTSGTYSDYGVRAVFPTAAQAEAARVEWDRRYGEGEANVEPWQFGEASDLPPGAFRVYVNPKGEVGGWHWMDGDDPHRPAHKDRWGNHIGYGETREHARRSAEEYRRAVLAGTVVTEVPDAP